jgi:hypothetical protein
MADFDKIFTEKEAYSLLTSCSLQYDPGHFSFKPRLFFTKDEPDLQIHNVDYNSEIELLTTIDPDVFEILVYFEGNICNNGKRLDYDDNDAYSNLNLALRHCNNYYILVDELMPALGFPANVSVATNLKNSNIYRAIVTFMLACSHYDSLIPHLKWLTSTFIDKPYQDVVDLKYFKEGIAKKDVSDCNVMAGHYYDTSCLVPYSDKKRKTFDMTIEDGEQIIFNSIVFTLEILNRIESIPNNELKETLYGAFYTGIGDGAFMECIYKLTNNGIEITPEARDVIDIKDMEQRYYAIRDFAKKQIPNLHQASDTWLNNGSGNGINTFLCELIKYCLAESIMNIRIRQIYILYDYCKNNNLLKEVDAGQCSKGLGLPIGGGDNSDDAMQATTHSMFKPRGNNVEGLPEAHGGNGVRPSTRFYEELDKLSTQFSDEDYSYNLITKQSEASNNKDAYDNIVSHMGMLTSELIRSIKEIKVYNTGGKNPGKSTGKLDRKNLHKYKTSKDIFFNNTYKIRESDLAFGILLDASGSMWGDGIKYGTHTMVVLTEVLKALNINHSIVAHNSDAWHTCKLVRYQAFKEDKTYSCNKNYALANIHSGSCNCDSGALRFMEKSLLRTKNKDKICIIFSDGEPTECSDTELKEQVRHMERNGIKVIGVGIDFPKIKEYYKNNANGSSLKEMFDIVANILKQYILEKVDEE